MAQRPCPGCGKLTSRSRCSRCSPPQLSTADRGYGGDHQAQRARWEPVIAAGRGCCSEIICLMNTRQIIPGEPWDLAHDRITGAWLGPAHRKCNRAEAARYANRRRASRWVTSRAW